MPTVQLASLPLISDANLIAYYKLENVNDSKGSNNLTNTGATPFNAAKFNNGADFGSSNTTKHLDVSANLGINGGDNLWMHCWVNLYSLPGTNVNWALLDHRTTLTADRYMDLFFQNVSGVQHLRCGVGGGTFADYTVTLSTGTWYMIDAVRDISANNYKLYVNGVLQATSGALPSNTAGANGFSIGTYFGGSSPFLPGLVDDVAVFNRVPTATDLSELLNGFTAYTMSAAEASFSLSAFAATCLRASQMIANSISYALSVFAATITKLRTINLDNKTVSTFTPDQRTP